MVKLKGPGMATGAAGQLGGAIVFSNWRGRSYAKKLTNPAQPRPDQQVASRAALTFLSTEWSTISSANQQTWDNYENLADLDWYHRYCQENLRTFQLAQAPSQLWPATRTGAFNTFASWTVKAQGRRAQHVAVVNALNDGWGALVFRGNFIVTDAHFDKVIHIQPFPTATTYRWWDGPLDPGNWHYRIRRITKDGNLSGYTSDRMITIS